MTYGITGNTLKPGFWKPVADLVRWMDARGIPVCLNVSVAEGLIERNLLDQSACDGRTYPDLAGHVDILLSFGGDGTMLRTAHQAAGREVPILGVNIGRLGFLAEVEISTVRDAIESIEAGRCRIEKRSVLEAFVEHDGHSETTFALNEFVFSRSGMTTLMSIQVAVDGEHLNTYWADGLIIASPTGSTAYSLSAGGPIIAPGSGVVLITPIAPHTLTARPIILPERCVIQARITGDGLPYVFAADGRSTVLEHQESVVTIRRASHDVHLVKLPDQHYFATLRGKLMWGASKHDFGT
jgi:NAD+ kinase